jgi:hypothetical protein
VEEREKKRKTRTDIRKNKLHEEKEINGFCSPS